MIGPSNTYINPDAKNQYLGLQFSFIHHNKNLIIQVKCLKNNQSYSESLAYN